MTLRLVVDRAACDGIGICAVLAGDVIDLDRWGYPVVEATVPSRRIGTVRAAVRACPRRALRLAEPE